MQQTLSQEAKRAIESEQKSSTSIGSKALFDKKILKFSPHSLYKLSSFVGPITPGTGKPACRRRTVI